MDSHSKAPQSGSSPTNDKGKDRERAAPNPARDPANEKGEPTRPTSTPSEEASIPVVYVDGTDDPEVDKDLFDKFKTAFPTWRKGERVSIVHSRTMLLILLTQQGSPLHSSNLSQVVEKLVKDHHIIDSIEEALSKGELATLCRIERVRAQLSPPKIVVLPELSSDMEEIARKFHESTYHGDTPKLFLRVLLANQDSFVSVDGHDYAKLMVACQTSGSGKTRLYFQVRHLRVKQPMSAVLELKLCTIKLSENGDVLLVYLNFGTSDLMYPQPDRGLMESICQFNDARLKTLWESMEGVALEAIYVSFFISLFEVIAQELQDLKSSSESLRNLSLAKAWHAKFYNDYSRNEERRRFLRLVDEHFWTVIGMLNKETILRAMPSQNSPDTVAPVVGFKQFLQPAYRACCDAFTSCCSQDSEDEIPIIPLLLAFDEASAIAHCDQNIPPRHQEYFKINRPAHIFARVISSYSQEQPNVPIWAVMTSTNSRIADFAGPAITQSSARLKSFEKTLFRPFTEFGMYQCIRGLEDIPTTDIAKLENIETLARPLLAMIPEKWSVKKAVTFCKWKLNNGEFNSTPIQYLVNPLQRFCLDLAQNNSEAVSVAQEVTSSHMSYLITTNDSRDIVYTTYPSEPILSHSAAETMCPDGLDSTADGNMQMALLELERRLRSGMVDKGQLGELLTRIILLLAKDSAARVLRATMTQLRYCRGVPFISWMKAMFGGNVFKGVEGWVVNAFKDYQINISHWAKMRENIGDKKHGRDEANAHWLRMLYAATAGMQCTRSQPLIDQVIPVWNSATDHFIPILI